MLKSTTLRLSLIVSIFAFSSIFAREKFKISGDLFGKRVITENKGQFSDAVKDQPISFAYDNSDEGVFFHQNSLTYRIIEHFPITESFKEKIEEGKKVTPKPDKNFFVNISWKNSNPNITPSVEGLQNHYQSYGDAIYKSNCYKKLIYKNVYNKIDVEYTFTDEKTNGIKYNVILKPGANLSDFRMEFKGDVKSIKIRNNELHIKTPYLTVKELNPVAIQNGQKLACNFILNDDNTVSFQIPGGYDPNEELIIDPWVVNLALTTNNYGYDVDYDYFGNYYVYGGSGPFLICKYNTAGALQWTFNGTVPSQGWTSLGSLPSGKYVGNFVVDKMTGKSYTGEGFNSAVGTRIVRIDANGLYDNLISTANITWNEVWDMNYDCANGRFFGIGGSTSGNVSAGILNTVTGAITPQSFTGMAGSQQDIASSTIDPQGNIFFVYATVAIATLNNRLLRVNGAFTGNVWIAPSTYNTFAESNNKFYPGAAMPAQYSNGFNALAASTSYLYYFDGSNLAAYNKATGAMLGSLVIPGLTAKQQGGIAVDGCDNVYIGGNGNILCYKFNGTSFSALPSIALGVANPNKYVTDIKYYEATNELYISGSGFGGIYSAINSLTCTASNCTVTTACAGVASASVSTGIASPVFSYSFTNSTGSVVASFINTTATTVTTPTLAAGNYTLFAHINAPCGPIITYTFNVSGQVILAPTAITRCSTTGITSTLSINATTGFTPAPTSYNWSGPGGFTASTATVVNNNAAVGIYTVSVSNGFCSGSGTVAVVAPGNFTPNITATNVTCFNGSDGSAFLSSITGTSTAPYTYTWSTSPVQNTALASNLIAGTYTLSVTDSMACTFSNTITITQPPTVPVAPTNTGPYCAGSTIQLNTGSFTTYTWTGPGGFTSNTQNPTIPNAQLTNAGQYTVVVTNANNCSYTGVTTLFVNPLPIPNIVTNGPVCVNEVLSLSGTGGVNYLWNGPNGFISSSQTPTILASSAAYSGNYSLTVTDANGCSGTTQMNAIVNALPTAAIIAANNTGCAPVCTSFTVSGSASIVTANWYMGDGSYDTGTSTTPRCYSVPGVYTVGVVASDANGCTGSNTATLEVYPIPVADFNHAPIKPILNIDQEVTFTDASWNAPIVSWNWYFMNTAQYTSILQNPTFMYTEPGTYPVALVVTSDKGCMDTLIRPLVVGEDYGIYVPNAFTPNADGLNDVFQPKGFGIVKYELNIFDRWGEKVFFTKEFNEGWNGTFQGRSNKIIEEGSYTWLINLTNVFGKSYELKGHVILMR